MKAPSIISLGEVLWDLLPDGEQFGGAPANFACHAAILGADVTMVSAVGPDQRGKDGVSILSSYSIDVSLMQTVTDDPTGTVGVELDDRGKPTFEIHQGSAWDQVEWTDELGSRITLANAIYFGTLGQRSEVSRRTIRQALDAATATKITRVLDINLRPPFFDTELIRDSIRFASILKLSDDELPEVCSACGIEFIDAADTMLRGLLRFGELDMVVVTRGANGAVLVADEERVETHGVHIPVVDTVGAGDAFTAAFLIGELTGEPRDDCIRKACAVAAAACTHSGAVPAPPA